MANQNTLPQSLSDLCSISKKPEDLNQRTEGTDAKTPRAPNSLRKRHEGDTVKMNLDINRNHHRWLEETARKVRGNATTPTPAGERVYPKHLVNLAIELLSQSDINWNETACIEDIRNYLNP